MKNVVQVCDINPEIIQGPYSLRLARAVTGQYLNNGAMYIGVHAAPSDLHDFYLTAIIDETSPDQSNCEQKLMVQGGAQYGCSARLCPFCVYHRLKYYRNLNIKEITDLFRLTLFIHEKTHSHKKDKRELILKFTDNGEPLETVILPEALDQLLSLFGCDGKILRLKISTIFKDTQLTRRTFRRVMDWQRKHQQCASIHLQISRSPYDSRLISIEEVREVIENWTKVNPQDNVCIAPGLVRGYHRKEPMAFCAALKPVTRHCFFRFSVIKPSTKEQRGQILNHEEVEEINAFVRDQGFVVSLLPQNSNYTNQLEGAGTLSHLPDEKSYDPATYHIWDYMDKARDPNVPNCSL